MRKNISNRKVFPNDDAVMKILFLEPLVQTSGMGYSHESAGSHVRGSSEARTSCRCITRSAGYTVRVTVSTTRRLPTRCTAPLALRF
jgi:hypothetical protein